MGGLRFHGDAIELSGVTGTKLKSEVLGSYYEKWWNITSGGESKSYGNATTIIELYAGTGEDYIPDINQVILGSSGHALRLKGENQNTKFLKLVLVEEDKDCFSHLKNVISRRWPHLRCAENVAETSAGEGSSHDVYLLNLNLDQALAEIGSIFPLGNSLFFFDPLLFTEWSKIESVAQKRIKSFYQTGTEFIIFLFTSDLFTGRKGLIEALPTASSPESWTPAQKDAVEKVNSLFGHDKWRRELLNSKGIPEKIDLLVNLYRLRLRKWFRYVLPFPFEPKTGQFYHIFMCSNYEIGVRITRGFYTEFTGNPKFSPDNRSAYRRFLLAHPEKKMSGNARCDEWKLLWAIIVEHEDGICDVNCSDLDIKQPDPDLRMNALQWLTSKGYLKNLGMLSDAWHKGFDSYQLDWDHVSKVLGVSKPASLRPLSSDNEK